MKVQNYHTTIINGRKRVSAEIVWETINRPREEIYFEVDKRFADDISPNPDAFFLATVIPALYYGEKRYRIEGTVCPLLYQGMQEALSWIYHWNYNEKTQIKLDLEVGTRKQPRDNTLSGNTASFFSGGIDSYATLLDNRSAFKETHPGYINDGIIAYGLEQSEPKKFEHVLNMLKRAAQKLQVNLIPVYTNIYLIYREEDALNDFHFWIYEFQGAALSAIAHILSNRLKRVSIAGTFDLVNLGPHGLHPLIDHNYSSNNLSVRHDGLLHSRLKKTRMVAKQYPPPIDLRVCNRFRNYEEKKLNCGKCEKCTRTMLTFLALGKLKYIEAFPYKNVTRDMVIKHSIINGNYIAACYEELIEPLKKIQRNDLVNAVKYVINRYNAKKSNLKSTFFKINEKYLNGKFSQVYKFL